MSTHKFVIYGAGGIGGTIGARLFQAGFDVALIARGEHAQRLRSQGLTYVNADGRTTLPIPCFEHPQLVPFLGTGLGEGSLQGWDDGESGGPPDAAVCHVLLCMKSQHTEAALRDLAQVCCTRGPAEQPHLVCVQNGVANERLALRYFARVSATVVNLPASYLTPGEVVHYTEGYGGILDTGSYPTGHSDDAKVVAQALTQAGFSARPDPAIMRQKYAKLLLNLGNVVQAAGLDEEAQRHLNRRLRKEALQCFAAAGIDCATKAEVEQRAAGIYRMSTQLERVAGSTWQSLPRGAADVETEYLNGDICQLGRLHGVATPANDAVVQISRRLIRQAAGPGSLTASEVLELLAQQ